MAPLPLEVLNIGKGAFQNALLGNIPFPNGSKVTVASGQYLVAEFLDKYLQTK